MLRVRPVLASLVVIVALAACVTKPNAPDARSPEPVQRLVASFCNAWNEHDGHALAAIMADDVDFVNVGARWFHGRHDFEMYHTRLLTGRFAKSRMQPIEIKVRFIRDDLAALHWTWSMIDDRNYDGTARPPRHGLMTVLAERRAHRWQIALAQNTNVIPGAAPEEEGIPSPVAIPGEH